MRIVALLFSLALLAGCNSVNAKTMSYASLAEARAAGAIDKGWVPHGLPEPVYELRVAYEPDGWQRWGLINFPREAGDGIRGLLETQELPVGGLQCGIPARIEWWPVILRQELDAERVAATGARGYRSRDGRMIFIVNWTQGRAYYWTTR